MKTLQEALASLAENRETLNAINEVDDPVMQGYQGAPLLAEASGAIPEQLAMCILLHGESNKIDALRSLGVIKWCLERMD